MTREPCVTIVLEAFVLRRFGVPQQMPLAQIERASRARGFMNLRLSVCELWMPATGELVESCKLCHFDMAVSQKWVPKMKKWVALVNGTKD